MLCYNIKITQKNDIIIEGPEGVFICKDEWTKPIKTDNKPPNDWKKQFYHLLVAVPYWKHFSPLQLNMNFLTFL